MRFIYKRISVSVVLPHLGQRGGEYARMSVLVNQQHIDICEMGKKCTT
jgi:hypothetical protein